MSGGPLLIDTDVFSYLAYGKAQSAAFQPLLAGRLMCMSFAGHAEALALGHRRQWGPARMAALRAALRQYVVLPYDEVVAERWAPMHVKLSGHLHGGGANDLWTAACALAQTDPLPIATNNLRDYQAVAEHFPIRIVHPDL